MGGPPRSESAIAHCRRVFKPLHILRLDDEPYRREGKRQSNLTEGRRDLARTVYHGKKGEMYRPTTRDGGSIVGARARGELRRVV
ncbi:transposase [Nocardia beijingensis]|uniref:transposase n=1 Tax=Nocardia beijingensis TaxID=95162 RepID=UPI001E345B97|nr:transposase [Nocardia beijingensis]